MEMVGAAEGREAGQGEGGKGGGRERRDKIEAGRCQ